MDKLKTTNFLLLILVIPVVFYILKTLSFIFIPLVFSMFLSLLFLPMMRWLASKKISKNISVFFVFIIIILVLKILSEVIFYASKEILTADPVFLEKAQTKILNLLALTENFLGVEREVGQPLVNHYLNLNEIKRYFTTSLNIFTNTLSMLLMTVFFLFLWLVESINFQKVLQQLFQQKHTSLKVFFKIEKDLIKFMKVKFFVSFLTGTAVTFACLFFDINFPIFWGLFAFAINFIQMIGSFITIIVLTIFAFIELDLSLQLLFFTSSMIAIQAAIGGVMEPILMGKSFSINVITILVMLLFWGFIWGIPGMIVSIPLTVFIKIILEQFPNTKILAKLLSGSKSVR